MRVWVAAGAALVTGILIGTAVVRKVWNLPPNWGDIPTWLAVAGAVATAGIALQQLNDLRGQVAEETERNRKRDQLVDKQLDEAERRARSERRRLVEEVGVVFTGQAAYVVNGSKRPINDVVCRVMNKGGRGSLASAGACGEVASVGPGWVFLPGTGQRVSRFESLRPGARCGFTFDHLPDYPDQVLVAWFTDDDGFRWQLDEYQHLVESGDEDAHLPIRSSRQLPQGAAEAIGAPQ